MFSIRNKLCFYSIVFNKKNIVMKTPTNFPNHFSQKHPYTSYNEELENSNKD